MSHFISFEGIEGVGKSTAIKFFKTQLNHFHIDFVLNREPGGTEISENIRRILLDHYSEAMSLDTELLLMLACRAQNIQHVILPALKNNLWVISDRFTDASYAYQGYGRGMPLERIKALAHWVHGDLKPNFSFLLDAPAEIGMGRLRNRLNKDRIEIERLEFFERVRQGYLELAAAEPERFRIIKADRSLMEVQQQILFELNKIFEKCA